MSTVLTYLFYLTTPALIIFLARRIDHISKLGTIVVAYGVGLVAGNIGVLPENAGQIQNVLTTATVPLALPLLFFSLRLDRWRELAGRAALSFVAALPAVMLAITTLVVAASFVRPIRRLRNSFQLGYYLILVFSITVSSMANVRDLAVAAPSVVDYVAILLGTVSLLHLAFSALFRVDRDTHIVSATSFIYSPPRPWEIEKSWFRVSSLVLPDGLRETTSVSQLRMD